MSLKLVVNNKLQWDALLEHFEERQRFHAKQAATLNDMEAVKRAQGAYEELERLKFLRDEVNKDDKK